MNYRLSSQPMTELPRPSYQTRTFYHRSHITAPDIRRICTAPDATLRGLRDRALLETFVSTGMSIASLATLTVAQIHHTSAGCLLTLFDDPTNDVCAVPINSVAHFHLLLWLNQRPVTSPFVFTAFVGRGLRLTDRPLSSNAVWRMMQDCANKVGLSTITPHDMQRFAIAQLVAPQEINRA